MAQSFWSKRKETINSAGSYIKATNTVSRPTAILMTVFGILVIGGLLFGIFTGTRWAYGKLTDNTGNVATVEKGTTPSTTSGPSITATSSTSTTTPSSSTTPAVPTVTATTTTPTVAPATQVATTTNKLPQTGPGNTTMFFLVLVILGYVGYRRYSLKS